MIWIPTARIESAAEPNDERVADVFFDRENSRLIATDGIAMVVIPVESEEEDIGGRIPVWVIKVARTVRGGISLRDEDRVIIQSNRGKFDGKRPTHDLPDLDRVLSSVETGEYETVIRLDAGRLFRLTTALLDDYRWSRTIILHIRGEEDPILIRPHIGAYRKDDDGRFGVLMPVKGGDG